MLDEILDFLEPLEMWVNCPYCKSRGVEYHSEQVDKHTTIYNLTVCPVCEGNKGWTEADYGMDSSHLQVRERIQVVR